MERRYSPDQPRDDGGKFAPKGGGSGGGGQSKQDKLHKFLKASAMAVAAIALRHYGWAILPIWAVHLVKKSLRAADLPMATPARIDEFLKSLSAEDLDKLAKDIADGLNDDEHAQLLAALEREDKGQNSMTTLGMEYRSFAVQGLGIDRASGKPCLRGHAAVFNQLSDDLGGFREQIVPGAFADALGVDKADVRALFNHDPNFVLGRTASGTLRLKEDSRGLAFECDVPDTQTVRDLVLAPIERGDISHMSFQFGVKPGGQDWANDDEGRTIRTLKSLRLFDVSPVTFPAYRQTDVALRELRGWQDRLARQSAQPETDFHLLRCLQQQASIEL